MDLHLKAPPPKPLSGTQSTAFPQTHISLTMSAEKSISPPILECGKHYPLKHNCILHGHVYQVIRIADSQPLLQETPSDEASSSSSEESSQQGLEPRTNCSRCRKILADEVWKCGASVCQLEFCERCALVDRQSRLEDANTVWSTRRNFE
jgi:hypothetical protein